MELTRIVRRDAISYVGSIETCSVWPQQGDEYEIVYRWELDESVNAAATRVGKALLLCTLGDWRRLPEGQCGSCQANQALSKNSLNRGGPADRDNKNDRQGQERGATVRGTSFSKLDEGGKANSQAKFQCCPGVEVQQTSGGVCGATTC